MSFDAAPKNESERVDAAEPNESEPIESPVLQAVVEILVSDAVYSLDAREVVQVMRDCAVREVPSRAAALLGVTGVRGGVVPVFSLAVLLGIGKPDPVSDVSWLVLCRLREQTVGLACDAVVGFKRVAAVIGRLSMEELFQSVD